MNVSVSSTLGTTTETPLQKEQKLFKELFARLLNALLNRMFDLRPETAARRLWYLLGLFFLSSFLLSLRFYPFYLWARHIQDIFVYFLGSDYPLFYSGNPIVNLLGFIDQVLLIPAYFSTSPSSLPPFLLRYSVRRSTWRMSSSWNMPALRGALSGPWLFPGAKKRIRISQGDIAEQDRQSPAYLIGGPGKVIVDLDSVALFEKPDGTPRIIGPTDKEPHGRAALDGFERFRQAVDIRDQYADLRDQDPKSRSVESRSLDGIRVTATDVRLMFSVYRGEAKPSKEVPYPFSKEAVEKIIYQATSRVTPGRLNPSTYEFSWVYKMIGLIRGELGAFMGRHELTAYLASIGMPELEKLKQREEAIVEQVQKLSQSEQGFLTANEKNSLPEFQARYKISNLFTQFAEDFTKRAYNSGVELHWIGVGTWKTPVEVIPEKHLEAWKLSNENLYRESSEALGKIEQEAIIQKTIALIQDVPVAVYLKTINGEPEHTKAMRILLLAYHQQLLEAADFMRNKGEAVPPNIEEAAAHINNMFGHFV